MLSISTLLLATTMAVSGDAAVTTASQIRETIARAVPYVEERGDWWITEKKCVSCHRTGVMVWSLAAARRREFAVSERLDEWLAWSIGNSLAETDGKIAGAANQEGVAQLLLARDLDEGAASRAESYDRLTEVILEGQEPDGSWKPDGQLPSQKRALSETTDVSTMWLALALSDREPGEKDRAATEAAVENALEHLASSPPGKSSEWYSARLLLAARTGDVTTADTIAKRLRDEQQADGGWSWTLGEKSDALATGLALYALLRAGTERDDEAVRNAQRFLVDTQQPDGSWPVNGTKAKKKDSIEETAVYWGTSWALLALVESLPE